MPIRTRAASLRCAGPVAYRLTSVDHARLGRSARRCARSVRRAVQQRRRRRVGAGLRGRSSAGAAAGNTGDLPCTACRERPPARARSSHRGPSAACVPQRGRGAADSRLGHRRDRAGGAEPCTSRALPPTSPGGVRTAVGGMSSTTPSAPAHSDSRPRTPWTQGAERAHLGNTEAPGGCQGPGHGRVLSPCRGAPS